MAFPFPPPQTGEPQTTALSSNSSLVTLQDLLGQSPTSTQASEGSPGEALPQQSLVARPQILMGLDPQGCSLPIMDVRAVPWRPAPQQVGQPLVPALPVAKRKQRTEDDAKVGRLVGHSRRMCSFLGFWQSRHSMRREKLTARLQELGTLMGTLHQCCCCCCCHMDKGLTHLPLTPGRV